MFGMKAKKEKLEAELAVLLEQVCQLSHTNRSKSGQRAEELQKQIDAMD